MDIRRADLRDLPELCTVFRDAVLTLGPQAYSRRQVTAWAEFADADNFPLFVATAATFVAEDLAGIRGFCGVEEDGHVASVYVRPDSFRRGIASRLLAHVISYAADIGIPRLHAEASHFSRPLFHKFGFTDIRVETVKRNNVLFKRFLVERLAGSPH
ncbi:MAG: GNAT family N-acetyltransferase [Planctomycetaceae bacterium]